MKHISEQPQYAEAAREVGALAAALGKVQGRIAEIEALMRTAAPDPETSHVAAALAFAETGQQPAPVSPSALSEEHLVLRQQRDALNKAIRTRSDALVSVTGQLSADLCRSRTAAHKALAARYLDTLRALDGLVEEEQAMVREIERAGYSASFTEYLAWPHLGTLREQHSVMFTRARDISRYSGKN